MERAELVRRLGGPDLVPVPPGSGVVVEERDPAKFMAAFAAAVRSGQNVFLADPSWGESERATLAAQARGATAGVRRQPGLADDCQRRHQRPAQVRPARWMDDRRRGARLLPAFQRRAGEQYRRPPAPSRERIHGLDAVRPDGRNLSAVGLEAAGGRGKAGAVAGAGRLVPVPRADAAAASPAAPGPETVAWLREFEAISIGGGPLWPELADRAARAELPLSPGYGLTETAAMAAALRPGEFLAGVRGSGAPLPHVRLDLTDDGLIRIAGESVCRGYFPDWNTAGDFTTDDQGRLDDRGHLHLLGRRDFPHHHGWGEGESARSRSRPPGERRIRRRGGGGRPGSDLGTGRRGLLPAGTAQARPGAPGARTGGPRRLQAAPPLSARWPAGPATRWAN